MLYDGRALRAFPASAFLGLAEFAEDCGAVCDQSVGVELDTPLDALAELAREGMGIFKATISDPMGWDDNAWGGGYPDRSGTRGRGF